MKSEITSAQTVEGEEVAFEMSVLYDLDEKRVYQTTSINGEEVSVLRFVDGKATMTIAGMDGEMPAPAELEAQLQQQLDESFSKLIMDPTVTLGDAELVSCDGFQTYGDVLAGEQITMRVKAGEDSALQAVSPGTLIRVILTEGQMRGTFQEISQLGPTLIVFDFTPNGEGQPTRIVMQQYSWDGSVAEATGTTTVDYSYDVPIDESLFNP